MIRKRGCYYRFDTLHTTLLIKAEKGRAEYLYYGASLKNGWDYTILEAEKDWAGNDVPRGLFSEYGNADFREPSILLTVGDASCSTRFTFLRAHKSEKPDLSPLPSAYDSTDTMAFEFVDAAIKLRLTLFYTLFADTDAISVSARITNSGKKSVKLLKFSSLQLDLWGNDYSFVTFNGGWASERNKQVTVAERGLFVNDSKTGSSSPFHNPFVMAENSRGVYGFNLVYSGNHKESLEANSFATRIECGISDFLFGWNLPEGESFCSPEAVMVYAPTENALSTELHTFTQKHIMRGKWRDRERPVLVNNWEGTEFRFTAEKIVAIAEKAAQVGAELFVLDDGWFGHRDDDTSSLGDWFDNVEKTGGGLDVLSDQIRALGLKFGIWVEPEMVSEDSELYRKHPEYTMRVPKTEPTRIRHQLMLNLADVQVQNYVVRSMIKVITSCKAAYVKWDYNRHITDPYGKGVAIGEYAHRYMLGLYTILARLTEKFPNVLFESCASGGGRFDLGMLCYMPQTWTSDNTDARDRLAIQSGTSYAYPQSTMGAHVSASPNLQSGNSTPLETRFNIACGGLLGYELDLTKSTETELAVIKKQITFYKRNRELLQFGTFYRLGDAFRDAVCGWMVVSPDRSKAIATVCVQKKKTGEGNLRFTLTGLDESLTYTVKAREQSNQHTPYSFVAGGDVLTNGSLTMQGIFADAELKDHSNPIFTRMLVIKKVPAHKKPV